MTQNEYYVYLYLREDGTPYYVGKGKGRRAFSNKGRKENFPLDENKIVFHSKNLTEDEAFTLEKELIIKYGRKNNNTGILINLTNGGEGVSGTIVTDEIKIKLSEYMKVRMNTPEMKAKISAMNTRTKKGKKLSDEHKRKVSESKKGTFLSDEHKRKLSESMKGHSVSEETKQKISEVQKIRWVKRRNDPNCTYNYKLSDAGRKILQERVAGENNPSKRPEVKVKIKATWARKRAEKLQESANLTEFLISDPVSA